MATRAINAVSQSSTYDAVGRVTGVTNVLGSFGYLTSVTGALSGSTTTFGYDGYGRLSTVMGSEGYVAGLIARLTDAVFWKKLLIGILVAAVCLELVGLLGYYLSLLLERERKTDR